MKAKPIIPREQANRDVDTVIASCLNDAGEAATLGFIDTLENAYDLIGRHPASGSPRYAHEFNLPGLRTWPLTRYPNSDRRCLCHGKRRVATCLTSYLWPI